ncbi:uncharacterized protein NPIL_406651 [Nephila pilipes]|uniref:CUB domain-containing protein n=1 Tax=Nephila pilipes TaxID=299642 RepID=A0A8X6T7M5_NEPPI|nr:uncharacterized protein NPIL_406651 [Nephila pilipes]
MVCVVLQCLLLNLLFGWNGVFALVNEYDDIFALCPRNSKFRTYKRIDGTVLTFGGKDNLQCVITFQTDNILQLFMLRFDHLALRCEEDLYIHDGAHALGNPKVHLTCHNTTADVGSVFTKTNFVTLKYVSGKLTQQGKGSKLVITSIKDSAYVCRAFVCSNGFCISQDLTCDDENHCGDNSDETSHASCIGNTTETSRIPMTSGSEIGGMTAGIIFITLLIDCMLGGIFKILMI